MKRFSNSLILILLFYAAAAFVFADNVPSGLVVEDGGATGGAGTSPGEDKSLSKFATKFLVSVEAGIQKDFSLHVLYFDRGIEESHWSFPTKAPAKNAGTVSEVISINAAVITKREATQIVDHLAKAKAFHRETCWPDGTPLQGWTVSLRNGENNLSWHLGKDRQSMLHAKDLSGLDTILKGEAKKLWTTIAAHGKK